MTPRPFLLLACASLIPACRGQRSTEPPIHWQQNMDQQRRLEAQEESSLFGDGRAMRQPPPHTIARGELRESALLHQGRLRGGKLASKLPLSLTPELLARGRERFDILCASCHGRVGDGSGPVAERGISVRPPAYVEPRLRRKPIGYFVDVIRRGARNMPSLAVQVRARDRWAIAAYVRALQLAGNASLEHVPARVRRREGWR